jgi:hypothetical protein
MNFFRSAGHTWGIHDSEEQFELVYVHLPSLNAHRRERPNAPRQLYQKMNDCVLFGREGGL